MSRVGDFSLGAGVESAIARVLEAAGRSGTRGDRVARLLDASAPAQLPYGLEVRSDVADPIVQEGPSPRTWHLGLRSLVDARPDDSGAPFCFAVSRGPAPRHLGSYELSGVCSRDERHLVVPPRDARSRDPSLPVLPLHRARVALPAALTELFAVGEALEATDELRGVFALIQGEADGAVVVGARNPWTILGAVLVARARGYVLLSSDGTPIETVSDLRSPFVIASSHLLAHQLAKRLDQERFEIFRSVDRGSDRARHDPGVRTPSLRSSPRPQGKSGELQDEKGNPRFFVPRVFRHDPRVGHGGPARLGDQARPASQSGQAC